MRRMIRNTTAIAACLSLLAPHLAQAQLTVPDPSLSGQNRTDASPAPVILAQAEVPPPAASDETAPSQAGAGQTRTGEVNGWAVEENRDRIIDLSRLEDLAELAAPDGSSLMVSVSRCSRGQPSTQSAAAPRQPHGRR